MHTRYCLINECVQIIMGKKTKNKLGEEKIDKPKKWFVGKNQA